MDNLADENSDYYFDAAIAAECLQSDGVIVSTDRAFDSIPNLTRIWD
jgi:predicted nucleic acid-binding protein